MKNKNLLPLLAVAGGLYLANQSGNKASEAQNKTLAFTGDTFADEEALKDALIKVIKANNIELRTLLRGSDGKQGDKGDTGATGLAGSQIQSYGQSLLYNSAFDFGIEGWTGGTLENTKECVVSSVFAQNEKKFRVDTDSLYSISLEYIADGSNNTLVLENYNYSNLSVKNSYSILPIVTVFTKTKLYFGGSGVNPNNFDSLVKEVRLRINKNNGNVKFRNIIVNKVSLGEPVPHNLPYLPLNQIVINNSTGKVGIYNGSTIDYFF